MNKLCIIGAGGHGKVVADLANLLGQWDAITFLDNYQDPGSIIGDWLVEGNLDCLPTLAVEDVDVIVAIGDNVKRMALIRQCQQWQLSLTTLIHPQAYVSAYSTIGAGSVVFANASVNIHAKLGIGCIINTGAVVEHECQLGDGVHISPNAALAGQVQVGAKSWIGMNASIKECTSIGTGVKIGAGAVVLSPIPDYTIAVGVPAKCIEATSMS